MRSISLWPIRSAGASSLMVLALLLSFSPQVHAQKYVTANVTVPFAFEIEGEVFPAGDYIIDSSVPSSIFILSKDGKHERVVPTVVNGEPVNKSEAKLIFAKRDGRYVLHALWGVLGKRTVTPELAQSASDKETKEVPLTYPSSGDVKAVHASSPQ